MAMPAVLPRYTPEEYLAIEREAELKSELVDGEIVAMTGGSPNHSRVSVALGSSLHGQLRGRDCEVFSPDIRVRIPERDSYFHLDVLVTCGGIEVEDEFQDTLLNPIVIIEVRSPSTALYDRTTKFAQYALIPSLRDYLLVAQDKPQVEHYARPDPATDWDLELVSGLEGVIELPSIGCRLALAEVYARVQFGG